MRIFFSFSSKLALKIRIYWDASWDSIPTKLKKQKQKQKQANWILEWKRKRKISLCWSWIKQFELLLNCVVFRSLESCPTCLTQFFFFLNLFCKSQSSTLLSTSLERADTVLGRLNAAILCQVGYWPPPSGRDCIPFFVVFLKAKTLKMKNTEILWRFFFKSNSFLTNLSYMVRKIGQGN